MRILYGVVGEGMGHAIRSRVVIEHLLTSGHQVEIIASSRACDFLRGRYGEGGVHRITGLHLVYEENRVRRAKTAWSNLQAGLRGVPEGIAAYFRVIDAFRPEVVVSDFESWTHLYGVAHGLPIVSIDNMQIINRCELPESIVGEARDSFRLTKAFVKSKLPRCAHYLVTSFFRPRVRKKNTTLVPPILRPEVLGQSPSEGEHLLVYQTGEGNQALGAALTRTGLPCRVYGMRRSIERDQVEGNLTYRPFSEAGFLADLASARGVVAGGGFTLLGEAVYLRKPVLAVPLARQFEQLLNARYLEHEGYGACAESLDSPAPIEAFVRRLPEYSQKLAGYRQEENRETLAALDALLDRAAAGLLR